MSLALGLTTYNCYVFNQDEQLVTYPAKQRGIWLSSEWVGKSILVPMYNVLKYLHS